MDEKITDFAYFTLCAKCAQFRGELAALRAGEIPARYPALDADARTELLPLLEELDRRADGEMLPLAQCPALLALVGRLEALLGLAAPEEDPYL